MEFIIGKRRISCIRKKIQKSDLMSRKIDYTKTLEEINNDLASKRYEERLEEVTRALEEIDTLGTLYKSGKIEEAKKHAEKMKKRIEGLYEQIDRFDVEITQRANH